MIFMEVCFDGMVFRVHGNPIGLYSIMFDRAIEYRIPGLRRLLTITRVFDYLYWISYGRRMYFH